MDKSETLSRLAELVGIEPVYWDIFGHRNETSEDTKRLMIAAMGLPLGEANDAAAEYLQALEERTWRRWLQFVTVIRRGQPMTVPLNLPADVAMQPIVWSLTAEDGRVVSGKLQPGTLSESDSRIIYSTKVVRLDMPLPEDISDGYYHLIININSISAHGMVVIAPTMSYMPAWFLADERRWGVACHLYALRSENDWGIGDFTTLGKLTTALAGIGATCIGLNPLHALFPHNPLHCSPYSPSSRLFLNPLYIDVSAVPELVECDRACKRIRTARFQKRLKQARATTHVDYIAVAALKFEVLELLHACFESQHPAGRKTDDRRRAFQLFCEAGGEPLYRFALYQALVDAHKGLGWHDWPVPFQTTTSAAVQAFAQEKVHARRIAYHLYLQWEADRQLGAAAQHCTDNGLSVGLYRDLAVGVDPAGADVWSHQETFAAARVGAPPDQFNAKGQDWGSPPFNPLRLQENGYADFIAVLRANMRHAGALRIDHVMALMHLFWIPLGGNPSTGAYVGYPFDDLLGIVALESHRHRCMVIGEDLGTVPPEFRDRMTAEGILSYRVLMFERWPGENLFKRPNTYPPVALATASTHDLPTVAGHWHGTDIALKRQLNLVSADQPAETLVEKRNTDRQLLRAALMDQELLGQDFPLNPALDDGHMQTLILAVHRFLARSSSRLMLVNLDDLLLETTQLNLPGTVDEYSNWQRKIKFLVENLKDNHYLHTSAAAIHADRSARPAV
ncbi:4-alpha-glucanotransferase (amylomaltase) [invertebrate metagenome]|uniref:4-alpha-glucanotransferase n=1 Tax=invertebrate metagenome TaxID=1711999 RepID=A0A484HAU5_9ZZZZ